MRHLAYRPEVDGLRALAVLSVLIFHLNSNWLPGGFLGVDIFFVISGFLITKIITNEILDGRFSYKEFYTRRIKRIYPVFILVMALVSIVASLIFLRHEAEQLRKTIELATVFFSNFYLSYRQGYFDLSANENPILHIWSLAVEEQYYLLFPLFLTLAYKKWQNKHTFRYIIIGLFIIFTLSSLIPDEAYARLFLYNTYYISTIRFPELLIGSFLAILPTNSAKTSTKNALLSLLSVTGILFCLVFYHKDMPHLPGVILFIPCLLTASLIYFLQTDSLTKRLFSLKPVVFIGKISYSLYLFHWVYIAFAYYITGEKTLSNNIILIIVLLSFTSSILTYYLLEQPIRKSKMHFKQAFLFLYLLPSLAVIGYNLAMRSSIKKAKEHWETSTAQVQENLENPHEAKILTIGDSHADHLYHFLNYVGNQEGWKSDILNVGDCILFVDSTGKLKEENAECMQYWQKVEQYPVIFISLFYDIKRGNKPVPRFLPESFVLANFDDEFRATVKHLAKTKKVYVFANNMSLTRSPLREFRLARFGIDNYLSPIQEMGDIRASNEQIKGLVADIPNVTWVNATQYLPNDRFTVNGQPIYADQDHFTHFGSYYLGKQFKQYETLLSQEEINRLYLPD
ncbi:acyltransferase family protein [Pasteurella sp. PK-2025]|uniref:acyltransferase family protein n=1 Tax=unclassified Pasteurella TaxID=2621516 RepID=UPI003C78DF3E